MKYSILAIVILNASFIFEGNALADDKKTTVVPTKTLMAKKVAPPKIKIKRIKSPKKDPGVKTAVKPILYRHTCPKDYLIKGSYRPFVEMSRSRPLECVKDPSVR